ncbi:MAG: pilus assembly protein PilM [Ruminococcus sp.]|nr:pilus assembly protein PilM [Ruminococcus sp.]
MLSFDFSDRQINIVKGDNSANKIRIERSLTIQVPEDMIVNGEVVNLSGLSDLVLTGLKSEQMMDRDAIVTFSSSNIVFKELVVPKAKGSEFLTMVQNHMSQEMGISNEYSISYTVVGEAGEDSPGAVKVLATACPTSIVEGFRKLFQVMGINLRSVNIGCNSISRIVLADKSNIDKMPLLVCQLDNNFLGLTLFENGQMAFARYVPISPDEYDSEDYVLEALNENIFRMEQFNKARGGTGLENVILYGYIEDYIKIVDALDGLDIKASVLSTPSQISGFENFEFTVFANAIGALYRRNKATERINLLEVQHSSDTGSGSGIGSMLTTAGILAAASAIVIAAVTFFINLRVSSIKDETEQVNVEIEKCRVIYKENEIRRNRLKIIETYKEYVQTAQADLDTLPTMDSTRLEKLDAVMDEHEATYKGFSFSVGGSITINDVKVNEQDDVKVLIDALLDIDYVGNCTYTGYTGSGEDDTKVTIGNITLTLNTEEGE